MNINRCASWQWDKPTLFATVGFMLVSIVAVGEMLREIPKFLAVYNELGIQLPHMTEMALNPWVHVAMGVILLVPLLLRHRADWKPRATAVWIVVLLTYFIFSHVAFFQPLVRLVVQLGEQQ